MRILVVDDDHDQREVRTMLLERSGFTTLQAGDKLTARAMAAQHHPQCVLLDLRLPTLDDGLELIRDLKKLDGTVRLLVLTGSRPQTFDSRPEARMVDDLLVKPTSTTELIECLRRYE